MTDCEPPPALSDASDQEVVAWARLGREDAYRELLRRYQGPICTFMYHMVHERAVAEDLTQETFVKAFRALDSYRPERPFSPWIHKIANNIGVDYLRRMQREARWLEDPLYAITPGTPRATGIQMPERTDSTPAPAPKVDLREFRAALERALQRLSGEYRRCYVLHDMDERSYGDIAEALDMPESTVRGYVHRARKQLKEMLDPEHAMKKDAGVWEDVGGSVDTVQTLSNQPRGVEMDYRVVAVKKAGIGQPSATVTVVL